jgi:hypothetical protein
MSFDKSLQPRMSLDKRISKLVFKYAIGNITPEEMKELEELNKEKRKRLQVIIDELNKRFDTLKNIDYQKIYETLYFCARPCCPIHGFLEQNDVIMLKYKEYVSDASVFKDDDKPTHGWYDWFDRRSCRKCFEKKRKTKIYSVVPFDSINEQYFEYFKMAHRHVKLVKEVINELKIKVISDEFDNIVHVWDWYGDQYELPEDTLAFKVLLMNESMIRAYNRAKRVISERFKVLLINEIRKRTFIKRDIIQ